MKEDQVIEKLIKEKVLDDKSIYVYASVKGGIGGVIGIINGLRKLQRLWGFERIPFIRKEKFCLKN